MLKPPIGKLKADIPNVKQVWYANDATGAGTCDDLGYSGTLCKNMLLDIDTIPMLPTHLVMKEEHAEKAREIFAGTGINITTEGMQHLGAAIASRSYTKEL